MLRLGLGIVIVCTAACAQGSLESQGSLGFTAGTTQTTTADPGDDDGKASTGEPESTSAAATSGAPSTETSSPSTDASSGVVAEESSSGVAPEDSSSSGAPITTIGESSSSDDGTPPPPDAVAWGACDEADCEAGSDCLNITGLREYLPWCSPTCVVDEDCPMPADGDAYIGCLASGEGEEDPTNCVLVCEYDGLDYGTCPTGMACAAVPAADPPISLCMWP